MIAQRNISKIPLKLPYICGTIKEQVKNIYDTKEILVGSVNCISTDNQNISAQSLLTAYEKNVVYRRGAGKGKQKQRLQR